MESMFTTRNMLIMAALGAGIYYLYQRKTSTKEVIKKAREVVEKDVPQGIPQPTEETYYYQAKTEATSKFNPSWQFPVSRNNPPRRSDIPM